MTSIERKLRMCSTLQDKLGVVLQNVEDGLRNGSLATWMGLAISPQRNKLSFRLIQKLDEEIHTDTAGNLVTERDLGRDGF